MSCLSLLRNPSNIIEVENLLDYGNGELEDYYPLTASGEIEDRLGGDRYFGRNVIWLGTEGRMVRAEPEYIRSIEGNIFDPDKLVAVVNGIVEADDRLVFVAPYGDVGQIGLEDVRESILYADDEGLDRPYTTGDDELDEYLVDPDNVLEGYGEPGDEDWLEAKSQIEKSLVEAVVSKSGDLGQWWIQIRDGNHRAMGALLANEPYVWVIVMDNTIQDLEEAAKEGRLTDEQEELMEILQ